MIHSRFFLVAILVVIILIFVLALVLLAPGIGMMLSLRRAVSPNKH